MTERVDEVDNGWRANLRRGFRREKEVETTTVVPEKDRGYGCMSLIMACAIGAGVVLVGDYLTDRYDHTVRLPMGRGAEVTDSCMKAMISGSDYIIDGRAESGVLIVPRPATVEARGDDVLIICGINGIFQQGLARDIQAGAFKKKPW